MKVEIKTVVSFTPNETQTLNELAGDLGHIRKICGDADCDTFEDCTNCPLNRVIELGDELRCAISCVLGNNFDPQ